MEDSSDYFQEQPTNELFSKQFQDEVFRKVVSVNDVVQMFIDSKTISNEECKKLSEVKVIDTKFRVLIKIITERCNRQDLGAFHRFITVLEETKNVELARQLKKVYDERENAIGIWNRLEKEKTLVNNLRLEITRLKTILEDKEGDLNDLKVTKRRLAEELKQTEKEHNVRVSHVRKELTTKIKDKERHISAISQELEDLKAHREMLESKITDNSTVIEKSEKELAKAETLLQKAIKESNVLRLEIDNLKNRLNEKVGKENIQLVDEIEKLENEIAEKENAIFEIRQRQTMTRAEVEEELRNILQEQAEKHDRQYEALQHQNESMQRQMNQMFQLMSSFMTKE